MHVAAAEARERGAGALRELRVDLDRVHRVRQAREDGGLIAGAGADLQHALAAFQRQKLRHQRDDIGL